MVVCLYNLYIFVGMLHGCLAASVFALDSSNSVRDCGVSSSTLEFLFVKCIP